MEEDKSPTAPSTDATGALDAQRVLEALQLREEQYRAIFEVDSQPLPDVAHGSVFRIRLPPATDTTHVDNAA